MVDAVPVELDHPLRQHIIRVVPIVEGVLPGGGDEIFAVRRIVDEFYVRHKVIDVTGIAVWIDHIEQIPSIRKHSVVLGDRPYLQMPVDEVPFMVGLLSTHSVPM